MIEKLFPVEQRKKYSERERAEILAEVFDTDRTAVLCGKHGYIGSDTPPKPNGCHDCWQAYWHTMIAKTPPHLRQERLQKLLKSLRDAVQMAERGEFDFEPYAHADIVTSKE